MLTTRPRRIVVAIALIAAIAGAAVPALATVHQNARVLPSKNPINLQDLGGIAYTVQYQGNRYLERTESFTSTWGDDANHYRGSTTISKEVVRNHVGYVTITIEALEAGLVIENANVTTSGGDAYAVQIASTTLSKNNRMFRVRLRCPGQQGTPPLLSIKWYTTRAPV